MLLAFSLLAALAVHFLVFADRPGGILTREFGIIFVSIPLLAGIVTLFSPTKAGSNGSQVAAAMGGVLLTPQSANIAERRLLNVVEEMALASGLPVPPVYVLPGEKGINAFAAGSNINNAVIGVTEGCLKQLTRDELQAVIGHEFSHVLNGDMRLNMRFAQLLFGLMCVSGIGRFLLKNLSGNRRRVGRSKNSGKGLAAVLLIAIVLYLFGLITAFLGKIIQAALNRQREFLADASSVQFTRTHALGSALKKIGALSEGSRLSKLPGEAHNHFFFSPVQASFLSTHPPLAERIRRIEPDWDGIYPAYPWAVAPKAPDTGRAAAGQGVNAAGQVANVAAGQDGQDSNDQDSNDQLGPVLSTALVAGAAVQAGQAHADLAALQSRPQDPAQARIKLAAASHEPLDACYLILALLLAEDAQVRRAQLGFIVNDTTRDTTRDTARDTTRDTARDTAGAEILKYRQAFDLLPAAEYFALIETSIPALKNLSSEQFEDFEKLLRRFIMADEVFSFEEWILYQLISSQVGAQYQQAPLPRPSRQQVKGAACLLLSALARLAPDEAEAGAAFAAGTAVLGYQDQQLCERPLHNGIMAAFLILENSSVAEQELFIQAALATVRHDGHCEPREEMFLRMLALCLGFPGRGRGRG